MQFWGMPTVGTPTTMESTSFMSQRPSLMSHVSPFLSPNNAAGTTGPLFFSPPLFPPSPSPFQYSLYGLNMPFSQSSQLSAATVHSSVDGCHFPSSQIGTENSQEDPSYNPGSPGTATLQELCTKLQGKSDRLQLLPLEAPQKEEHFFSQNGLSAEKAKHPGGGGSKQGKLKPHMRVFPLQEENGIKYYPVVDPLSRGTRYVMCGFCDTQKLYNNVGSITRHLRNCNTYLSTRRRENDAARYPALTDKTGSDNVRKKEDTTVSTAFIESPNMLNVQENTPREKHYPVGEWMKRGENQRFFNGEVKNQHMECTVSTEMSSQPILKTQLAQENHVALNNDSANFKGVGMDSKHQYFTLKDAGSPQERQGEVAESSQVDSLVDKQILKRRLGYEASESCDKASPMVHLELSSDDALGCKKTPVMYCENNYTSLTQVSTRGCVHDLQEEEPPEAAELYDAEELSCCDHGCHMTSSDEDGRRTRTHVIPIVVSTSPACTRSQSRDPHKGCRYFKSPAPFSVEAFAVAFARQFSAALAENLRQEFPTSEELISAVAKKTSTPSLPRTSQSTPGTKLHAPPVNDARSSNVEDPEPVYASRVLCNKYNHSAEPIDSPVSIETNRCVSMSRRHVGVQTLHRIRMVEKSPVKLYRKAPILLEKKPLVPQKKLKTSYNVSTTDISLSDWGIRVFAQLSDVMQNDLPGSGSKCRADMFPCVSREGDKKRQSSNQKAAKVLTSYAPGEIIWVASVGEVWPAIILKKLFENEESELVKPTVKLDVQRKKSQFNKLKYLVLLLPYGEAFEYAGRSIKRWYKGLAQWSRVVTTREVRRLDCSC